jgi:hypothetical protein
MTAALPAIAPKLQRLIPMLATNHDGEVVATARAIGRTLQAAGLDWHDLAERLAAPTAPQSSTSTRSAPHWRAMTLGTQRLWLAAMLEMPGFSRWEANFLATIAGYWLPRALSEKQVQTLDRLIERAWDAGVRI